jgi:hypothetical protein
LRARYFGACSKIMAIVERHGLPLSVSTRAANHLGRIQRIDDERVAFSIISSNSFLGSECRDGASLAEFLIEGIRIGG